MKVGGNVFNPKAPNKSGIIRGWFTALSTLVVNWRKGDWKCNLTVVFMPLPPMVGFRQPPNLKSMLCKAKLPGIAVNPEDWGLSKCGKPRCPACPKVKTGQTICANIPKKHFQLKSKVDCESTYVVYVISCQKCASQYIGETKRRLKTRVSEHIWYARQGDTRSATGVHFSQNGHTPEDMIVQVLEQTRENKGYLQQREDFWIGALMTRQKPGLNVNL